MAYNETHLHFHIKLSDDGPLPPDDLKTLEKRIRKAIKFANQAKCSRCDLFTNYTKKIVELLTGHVDT